MANKVMCLLAFLFLFSLVQASLTEVDIGGGVHIFIYCNEFFEYVNDFHISVEGVTITSIGDTNAPPGPEWGGHFTPGGFDADWWTSMPPDGDPIFNGECDTFLIVVDPTDVPFGYRWRATQDGAAVDSGSGTALALSEEPYMKNANYFFVNVSPNPFNSSVQITVTTGADIAICDIMGNIILTEELKGERHLKGGVHSKTQRTFIWHPDWTVSSGIYLIHTTTLDGQVITKRIVYLK